MAEKDAQIGIVLIIVAVVFLMSGLEMLEYSVLNDKFSTLVAFALVAVGVYLVAKK